MLSNKPLMVLEDNSRLINILNKMGRVINDPATYAPPTE